MDFRVYNNIATYPLQLLNYFSFTKPFVVAYHLVDSRIATLPLLTIVIFGMSLVIGLP